MSYQETMQANYDQRYYDCMRLKPSRMPGWSLVEDNWNTAQDAAAADRQWAMAMEIKEE